MHFRAFSGNIYIHERGFPREFSPGFPSLTPVENFKFVSIFIPLTLTGLSLISTLSPFIFFRLTSLSVSFEARASYENATAEVQRWKADNLPIDVWALDMNWRLTDNNEDRTYDHPNTQVRVVG